MEELNTKEAIKYMLEDSMITSTKASERIGKGKLYITGLIARSNCNPTIDTLIDIANVLGYEVTITKNDKPVVKLTRKEN